jgi:hypothetical protein
MLKAIHLRASTIRLTQLAIRNKIIYSYLLGEEKREERR